MSRGLYWILAPFLVVCAVALPLLISNWTIVSVLTMIGIEVFIVGLVIGLYDVHRHVNVLRAVAGVVCLAYVCYLVSIFLAPHPTWIGANRAQPSVLNAILGLVTFGVPSFWFMVHGYRLLDHHAIRQGDHLLFATSNPHKIDEVAAILAPLGIDVVGLSELETAIPEPIEDGATFQANARIKAVYYAQQTKRVCLADDSGLEVDALNGNPGVYSARYAGHHGKRAECDQANNDRLLEELRGVPLEKRIARFVCAMCLADANGSVLAQTRGSFEGVIATEPSGENGFGYDPLLYLPDVDCTSAELSPQQKNARSHRGVAARLMADHFHKQGQLSDPA